MQAGRTSVAVALVVTMTALSAWGCRRDRTDEHTNTAPSSSAREPASAGGDVISMLGGLRPGERLEGFEVTWVGAVREDGAVVVRLERGGRRMRLAVALSTNHPRPAVSTNKYALYYEDTKRSDAASEEDCLRVLETLAARIRKVEASVPAPSGMKPMPPPSSPM